MFAETFESPNVHALAFGAFRPRLRRVVFRAERQLQRGFIGAFAQTATAFSGALGWRYDRDFERICALSDESGGQTLIYTLWKRFHSHRGMQFRDLGRVEAKFLEIGKYAARKLRESFGPKTAAPATGLNV